MKIQIECMQKKDVGQPICQPFEFVKNGKSKKVKYVGYFKILI